MREKKGSLLQSRVVLTAVVGAVLVLQWYMVTGFMGSGTSPVALFPQVVESIQVEHEDVDVVVFRIDKVFGEFPNHNDISIEDAGFGACLLSIATYLRWIRRISVVTTDVNAVKGKLAMLKLDPTLKISVVEASTVGLMAADLTDSGLTQTVMWKAVSTMALPGRFAIALSSNSFLTTAVRKQDLFAEAESGVSGRMFPVVVSDSSRPPGLLPVMLIDKHLPFASERTYSRQCAALQACVEQPVHGPLSVTPIILPPDNNEAYLSISRALIAHAEADGPVWVQWWETKKPVDARPGVLAALHSYDATWFLFQSALTQYAPQLQEYVGYTTKKLPKPPMNANTSVKEQFGAALAGGGGWVQPDQVGSPPQQHGANGRGNAAWLQPGTKDNGNKGALRSRLRGDPPPQDMHPQPANGMARPPVRKGPFRFGK